METTSVTRPGFINLIIVTDEGDEDTVEVPAKNEVCHRCDGHGTHLRPAIGEHAYTVEEFYEAFSEPEDREEYFRRGGIYDVTCEVCGGANVVPVPDEDRMTKEQKEAFARWEEQEEENAAFEAECRAERMMEARMLGEY